MLGAEGVQCGTVFCACDEVNVHQNYKDMVIKAKDNSTRVTGRSYGHPVRQIRNAPGAGSVRYLSKNSED